MGLDFPEGKMARSGVPSDRSFACDLSRVTAYPALGRCSSESTEIAAKANRPRNETLTTLERQPVNHASSKRAYRVRFQICLALVMLVCVLAIPSSAAARDSSARKVGRGAANLTLGILALPGEIVSTTRESGPFVGATWGFAKGVGMLVATELVGVWEIVTSPFETPPGFKPIIKPEFPWGHFYEGKAEGKAKRRR
jgi:putative exosortase-associated protein (TIGR04073 family)